MKVIDLLNKIANGEEVPKKIKYEGIEYTHIDNYCYADKNSRLLSYEIYAEQHRLNDEIEIIEDIPKEDKKIDKLDTWFSIDKDDSETMVREEINTNFQNITEKIDEIIDRLNGE